MALATKIKTLILTGILPLTGIHMSAQVVYSCDFENAAENGRWTLNKIAGSATLTSWKNIWRLGSEGGCASPTGLYIYDHTEGDTVNLATSSNTTDFIVAYRDTITLPGAGTYRISFDWHAKGKNADGLYVYWVPDTYTKNTNSATGTASVPAALEGYKITTLRGSGIWKSYSGTFTAPSAVGKLLFLWYQASGPAVNPPAAVDNIEICLNTACDMPSNLKYNSSGVLTWSGSAASYDVRYCNSASNNWVNVNGVTTTSCPVSITEGYYIFQVRANCATGVYSEWVTLEQFAYIKGIRCLDFMDLDIATCYRGPFDNVTGSASTTRGKVDNGYASINSFHTIHYMPDELDPRAESMLRTVPEGEVASVRLGNWLDDPSIGGMGAGEAIEYKYKVLAGQSDIMQIKYAVVMEKPGHNNGTDPHFTLEILDSRGAQIQPANCFKADFAAASDHPEALVGWNEWSPGSSSGIEGAGSDPIIWKDWTLINVSLRNYVGQTLTIRFTTMDCRQSAHWAYAYFTIGCTSGGLQGIACGDFSTDHFTAPAGFNYAWYKASEPNNIISRDSVLSIPNTDTTLYVVDVISKLADGCYYSLVANPNPRFPETRVTPRPFQRECQNVVRFSNKSGVVYINRETYVKTISEEAVEDIEWFFDDGSPVLHSTDSVVEHMFPQNGGTFNVRVVSSMSGGVCLDTLEIPLTLPSLGDKRIENNVQFCYDGKTPYTYNGKNYTASFSDSTTTRIGADCDSTYVLHVNFVERVTSELFDTICGEVNNYTYAGTIYDKTGDYPVRFTSSLGCDSIVTLHLYKHPMPRITVDSAFAACADETNGLTIPYSLTDIDATVDSIYVIMGDEAVANGFEASYAFAVGDQLHISWPADISPNVYQGKVVFSSPWCKSYAYAFKLELNYPSSTLDQKNGIVAVLNHQANGGYDFVSYQWYRNGEMVDGETASYIRVSDEEDMNAEYYVVVLRGDDNVVLRSCPIIYHGGSMRDSLTDIRGEKTAIKVIEDGVLYIIRDGIKYTVLGTITERIQ